MHQGDDIRAHNNLALQNAGEAYPKTNERNSVQSFRSDSALPVSNPHDARLRTGTPLLEVNVFGGFEVLLDGVPVKDPTVRQRRVRLLLGILAINQGKELYCDYIASSIWPESSYKKRCKGFYNVWWLLNNALDPGSSSLSSPYLRRQSLSCVLSEENVVTDASRVLAACERLMDAEIDAYKAMSAYRALQASYRGDLLPGEGQNAIILRARDDWRNYVGDALHFASLALQGRGDRTTALWLSQAACRVDPYREDLLRLRMRMLIDAGRSAAALQVYNDAKALFEATVGISLSPQTQELYSEIVGFKPVRLEVPVTHIRKRSRRRTSATG